MKRPLLISLIVSILFSIGTLSVFAQTTGDYRSITAGNWSDASTWESYNGTAWIAASAAPDQLAPTVTIQAGHTVTLTAIAAVNDLVLEGTLVSGTSAQTLRVANSINIGTSGAFGSSTTATQRVTIEGYKANGTITLSGTPTYYVENFLINALAQNLVVNLNNTMNVRGYLRGYYSQASGSTAGQDDDNVTININGTTTLITNSSSAYFNDVKTSSVTNVVTAADFGNYTYNINGTLDLRSTGTSHIIPHATKAVSITVNVNGTWFTGNAMRITPTGVSGSPISTPVGKVYININNTGVVDAATKATNLVYNVNTTNSTSTELGFFNIVGNGKLLRNISTGTSSGTNGTFPLGSNGTFNPVTITAPAGTGVFSVRVANVPDNGKAVVKKHFIVEKVSGDITAYTAAIGWQSVDQSETFAPSAVNVYTFDSGTSSYGSAAATTVTGSGTMIAPYIATTAASAITAIPAQLMVANETPLPLTLLSFTAKLSGGLSPQVQLAWKTASEVNTKDFDIERSADGVSFQSLGKVAAKNIAGINTYSFTDKNPLSGLSYYRLKQSDLDGRATYSFPSVVKNKGTLALVAYPNPVAGLLTVEHSQAASGSLIKIKSISGQLVLSSKVETSSNKTTLDVSSLTPGVYILGFESNEENEILKLVKL